MQDFAEKLEALLDEHRGQALTEPEVRRVIIGFLVKNGCDEEDVEDAYDILYPARGKRV